MTNSTFSTPASVALARASSSISSVMSRPIALPVGPTRRARDQDVGAGAGAEVEHDLALVQVGDGRRDAAAERRADRGRRAPLVGAPRRRTRTEPNTSRRARRSRCRWTPPPAEARRGGRLAASAYRSRTRLAMSSAARFGACGRAAAAARAVAAAGRLVVGSQQLPAARGAALGVQLSHADSSFSASGIT